MKRYFVFFGIMVFSAFKLQAQVFDDALKQLVNNAFEKSDTVKVNNIRIAQAKIDEQTTRYNYLPRVNANITYTRLNEDIVFPQNLQTLLLGTQRLLIKEQAGIAYNAPLPHSISLKPIEPIQDKNVLKSSANMQWLLFSGFKIENGIKAYQHQQKALGFGNEKQKTKLFLEIADLYDKLALLHAADSVINRSTAVLNEQSRYVEAAIKNGLATPLERKKIELAHQKLQLKIVENRGAQITLLQRLHQLTGVDIKTLSEIHPLLQPLLLQNDSATLVRNEIKALDEAIQATRHREKAEKSEYIPKLAAFGQYEFLQKDLSLLDPRWYVGLRLQWNIFDGLNARNNAKKIALDRKAFEVQKIAVEDLLDFGRAKARQDVSTANQKIAVLNAQVALSNETFEFVSKQYKNGLTNITELLNALNDLEKARFDLQQGYFEQRKSSLQLLDVNGTLLNNL